MRTSSGRGWKPSCSMRLCTCSHTEPCQRWALRIGFQFTTRSAFQCSGGRGPIQPGRLWPPQGMPVGGGGMAMALALALALGGGGGPLPLTCGRLCCCCCTSGTSGRGSEGGARSRWPGVAGSEVDTDILWPGVEHSPCAASPASSGTESLTSLQSSILRSWPLPSCCSCSTSDLPKPGFAGAQVGLPIHCLPINCLPGKSCVTTSRLFSTTRGAVGLRGTLCSSASLVSSPLRSGNMGCCWRLRSWLLPSTGSSQNPPCSSPARLRRAFSCACCCFSSSHRSCEGTGASSKRLRGGDDGRLPPLQQPPKQLRRRRRLEEREGRRRSLRKDSVGRA
mmetsp:Transcript_43025/g.77785  ORF Transcript_43025/g.77785 Transcript_43025/m.77785 type:complete len:336 (+) Transcript_43025:308-1315(+)